jgi:hypothetical protein
MSKAGVRLEYGWSEGIWRNQCLALKNVESKTTF